MAVIDAMKSHHFDAVGPSRTYWDFYVGFGVIIDLYQLLQAVVLWQLAALAKTDALRVRPIVVTFLMASIINAALSWKFFFAVPLILNVVIALCLGWAVMAAGKRAQDS
ncbi:hypothetical protein ACFPZD_01765 [Dyella tabacisoli]|nr:hypothetical protein [Dyella tabacisoli]